MEIASSPELPQGSGGDWSVAVLRGVVQVAGKLVLLATATTVAVALTATVTALLPGVPQKGTAVLAAYLGALLSVLACAVMSLVTALPDGPAHGPLTVRGWRGRFTADVRRFVADVGVVTSRRRPLAMAAAGTVAGVLSIAQIEAFMLWPALAATALGPDSRVDPVLEAPSWVQAVYFAVVAPFSEEVAFRGGLLLVVAYLARHVKDVGVRRGLVVLAVIVTAVTFGASHAEFSLLNAVTACVSGVLFGVVAVWARSIWPAVLAHAMVNLWVGILLAIRLASLT
jgi:membrane protease YdiL (CAAX protease family)